MKKIILGCIFTIITTTSCQKEDNLDPLEDFYKNFYTVNIFPTLTNFKQEVEKEIYYIEKFKSENNLSNFHLIQNQWLQCAKSYSKARIYNYVPLKQFFFDVKIYNYPVSKNEIEKNIVENKAYSLDYFKTKSSKNKGLATLEYLLYTKDSLLKLQQDKGRIEYLLGVSKQILYQTNLLIYFWENNYKEKFINSKGATCTTNARCLAFNQLINILDVIKVGKVGKPAGFEKSDIITPKSLEAYTSQNSLQLIKASLLEIEQVYTLSSVNFADIVNDIDHSKKLSSNIQTHFKKVYKTIDDLDVSLYNAILNKNKKVKNLYDSLAILSRYFAVDGASLLSVTVLPTDNDGD